MKNRAGRSDSFIRSASADYSIFGSAAIDRLRPRAPRGESFNPESFDPESFDPESFDPELTTEGLTTEGHVAGCGSLSPGSIESAESVDRDP